MKDTIKYWNVFRLLFAAIIIATQVVLWIDSWSVSKIEPLNFFGYWTNQGNIIGAIALLLSIKFTTEERPLWIDILRFVATTDLIIVTVLYWGFVNGDDVGVRFVWANYVVHLITGVMVLLDWILEGPKKRITFSKIWIATIYPLFWLIVTGLRFLIDGWVPYAVLEPQNGVLAITSIVIIFLVSSVIFGCAVIFLQRIRFINTQD